MKLLLRALPLALALATACEPAPGEPAACEPVDASHEPPVVLDASVPAHDASCPELVCPAEDAAAPACPPTDRPTVYYVIRHAERDPGLDPPLNADGEARALRLAQALGAAGIEDIVVTSFLRNQQTAAPLAARTDAPVTTAPLTMTTWAAFGAEVGAWQLAREVPGSTVLMIGHSGGYNNALLRALGSSAVIGERYQDLVVVTREADGTVRTAVLEYGGRSPLDP
jgi:phosphohistidine phosphatase SixA